MITNQHPNGRNVIRRPLLFYSIKIKKLRQLPNTLAAKRHLTLLLFTPQPKNGCAVKSNGIQSIENSP
ncbi:MAG: hypothetical protein K2N87_15975, partial [Eubacterium sp.]|nr:hypothetical protein [Eubacterium sp.]